MIKPLKVAFVVLSKTFPVLYDATKSDEWNNDKLLSGAESLREEHPDVYDTIDIKPYLFSKNDGWNPHDYIVSDNPDDKGFPDDDFEFDPDVKIH
jgi:hypothetical protein